MQWGPAAAISNRRLEGPIPLYANFCRVHGTPEELIVDFGLNPQPPLGTPAEPIPVMITQRIITNYYTAKRMLHALTLTIQHHEAAFGVLETDVQRRVQTHTCAPASARRRRRPAARLVPRPCSVADVLGCHCWLVQQCCTRGFRPAGQASSGTQIARGRFAAGAIDKHPKPAIVTALHRGQPHEHGFQETLSPPLSATPGIGRPGRRAPQTRLYGPRPEGGQPGRLPSAHRGRRPAPQGPARRPGRRPLPAASRATRP